MDIKPIRTRANYRAALKEIEKLMGAKANTPEGEKLDVLVTLVEAYERKHYALDLPDPVEAIKFEMDQRGLTVKDLEDVIGRPNRVYEVLSYRRSLTLPMIQRLHSKLGIPADCSKPNWLSAHRGNVITPVLKVEYRPENRRNSNGRGDRICTCGSYVGMYKSHALINTGSFWSNTRFRPDFRRFLPVTLLREVLIIELK